MKKQLKEQLRQCENLIVLLFKIILYFLVFWTFYRLYAIENWQLLSISRTAAVTILSYLISGYLFLKIYGGYDINVFWQQFIPPNVKIVYCVEIPFCTNGYYYYMNDFDYLFAFLDYIYDKKVYKEIDLVGYIHLFLRDYFVNPFEENSRQKRFGLLCDKHGMYYPPSKERSILDFKGNSTAMCTEYDEFLWNGYNLYA